MHQPYQQPYPGHYRLAQGIRIVGELAICEYPLRAVRLSTTTARLLHLCAEQHSCEELAQEIDLPGKRVESLCEQLRWKGLLEAGPARPPAIWPGVSIIIPSYNRARQLERCLRALFVLDYPTDGLEIIVVDDASTDETASMLQQLLQEPGTRKQVIHIIRQAHRQGVARSRNSGAEAARYELLAYIDSDCVASPNWLAELVPAFQDAQVGAVGGIIRAYERRSMPGRYEDVRSSLFMGNHAQQVRLEGALRYLPTANFLVRRAVWQRLGGFASLTFGEDVDFCRRLLVDGFNIVYLPKGAVYHDYRTSLWAFLSIRASYASSEAALLQRHPAERRVLLLPPEQATFAGMLIGGVLGMIAFGSRFLMRPFGKGRRIRRGEGGTLGNEGHPQWAPSHLPATPVPTVTVRGECRGRGGWVRMWGPLRVPFVLPPSRFSNALGREPHSRPDRLRDRWLPGHIVPQTASSKLPGDRKGRPYISLLSLLAALLLTLLGTRKRLRKVRKQRIPIGPLPVLQATLRGHFSYTYHLCRHLTRYYTLPLLIIGIFLPPLLLLALILIAVVIAVDYRRLRPHMSVGQYAFCSLLDDCAYEVGVVWGSVKHKSWKALIPIIRLHTRKER